MQIEKVMKGRDYHRLEETEKKVNTMCNSRVGPRIEKKKKALLGNLVKLERELEFNEWHYANVNFMV